MMHQKKIELTASIYGCKIEFKCLPFKTFDIFLELFQNLIFFTRNWYESALNKILYCEYRNSLTERDKPKVIKLEKKINLNEERN